VGNNEIGQCNVGDWTDIVEVAVGWGHTVGLRADGTVVAVGDNDYGQCKISGWTDIEQVSVGDYYSTIAAGYGHTVGVKVDGTVVAGGLNDEGQCNTYGWTDIVEVAAGSYHTVGLRTDRTVLAAGAEVELAKWNLGSPALDLTISSAVGGGVTQPGEGTFNYYPGRRLNLIARPEGGYHFVGWTGDTDTVADVDAGRTTIVINDTYSITANFEEGRPANWALIGGIAGGVVIAGLVTFLLRRKKGVQKRRRGKKNSRTKRR
jgi:hypothetical protein